jgi:hypothetical protein
MTSTFSNIGIELITTGEQSGTWGSTTNTNLQIIDRLTNGIGAITLSGTTHTLSTTNSGSATLSDGQYSVLVFGGSPSGTNTVTISPNDVQHVYFIKNASGESVVLTQGSGGNVTIANGKSAIVYADGAGAGAEVVDLTNTFLFQPLTRAVAASGTSGTLTPNSDTTDIFNAFALDGATALDVPSGTPIDGQRLILRLRDDGTARALTWTITSGGYRVIGSTLPSTTTISKLLYVGCVYNSTDSFWDVVAVTTQA